MPRTQTLVVASLAVAALALGGGTAVAAGKITSKQIATNAILAKHIKSGAVGSDEIADGSVTGADLAPGSVTGAQVDESTLGTVPKATTAGSATTATTATTATSATHAADASSVGGVTVTTFHASLAESLTFTHVLAGGPLELDVACDSTLQKVNALINNPSTTGVVTYSVVREEGTLGYARTSFAASFTTASGQFDATRLNPTGTGYTEVRFSAAYAQNAFGGGGTDDCVLSGTVTTVP